MEKTLITEEDVRPIMQEHAGNRVFAAILEDTASGIDLLWFLGQYTHFNSVFGAGVATLAGEIARRQEMFRDPAEKIEIMAEQSIEVASAVFYAAIDEFARNRTHRSMAKKCIKEIGKYFGYAPEETNGFMPVTSLTITFMQKVTAGYCPSLLSDESQLHQALGFHIASEIIADEEFNLLDHYLRTARKDLVEHLKNNKAYAWVQVHTTVEADHFEAAVQGANLALEYYVGRLKPSEVKELILQGFTEFANLQTDFMVSLQNIMKVGNQHLLHKSSHEKVR